jgi:hypothetical protein
VCRGPVSGVGSLCGYERGFGLGSGVASGCRSGYDFGFGTGFRSGLESGPDPGCVLIADLKPVLFSGKPGAAPGFAANQGPSPRTPELSTVPSPISSECTPELSLNHGSGVDADSLADVSIGVVGDISAQGEGSRRLSQVRFPDFPLPREDALSVSSNDESDSGAPVAVDLAKNKEQLTKNKELLEEDLDEEVEVFSKEVHRTLKVASVVGMIKRCWTCSLPGRGRLKG